MTVGGVQENESRIMNEEHDHTNLAKRVINIGSLVSVAWDYVVETEPTTSSEVYTFKTGGSGGTTVATVTVTYFDSTKNRLVSVGRS